MSPKTSRQQAVLDYLEAYIGKHGYAPTVREIGEEFGWSSPSTVQGKLDQLEREGSIERIGSRAIRIVQDA